jgi:hypothetical protein
MKHAIALAFLVTSWILPARAFTGAVVESWRHDAESKVLTLKIANVSGKDITAYYMGVTLKFADGTTDALADGEPSWGRGIDLLGALVYAEMTKDLPDEKKPRQKFDAGFATGTTRYDLVPVPHAKDIVDVKAVFDTVIYADGTADVGDEQHFKGMMAQRKGGLLAMQKVDEVVKQALSDPTVTDPTTMAKVELTRRVLGEAEKRYDPDDPARYQGMLLRNAVTAMEEMKDRRSLERYVEDIEKRIALTAPHCNISIQHQ